MHVGYMIFEAEGTRTGGEVSGIWGHILEKSVRGVSFGVLAHSPYKHTFLGAAFQTGRLYRWGAWQTEVKDNHLTQTFPAPPGTGKGEEKQTGFPCVLALGGCGDQAHLTRAQRNRGGFWKPGEPLGSCHAWGTAGSPGAAFAMPRPGSSWHQADFSPRRLGKSCKPHLLSPQPHRGCL